MADPAVATNPFTSLITKAAPPPNPFATLITKKARADQAEEGSFIPETAKGIAGGATTATASAIKGLAGQQELAKADRTQMIERAIEAIEKIKEGQDPNEVRGKLSDWDADQFVVSYLDQQSAKDKEDVLTGLKKMAGLHLAKPVQETELYQTGKAVQEWGEDKFRAAKDYENTWSRTITEGLGSTVPIFAAAVLSRGASIAGGSMMSTGEAIDRAIKAGATKEQILQAVNLGGVPGLTETMPFDALLNKVPLPAMGKVMNAIVKIGATALAEGGQEALQQTMQNIIAKYVYKPDQDITEGVAKAAAVGAIVGGIISTPTAPFTAKDTRKKAAEPEQVVVNDPEFTANDGTVQPAGDLHGQTVEVVERGQNMSRVRTADGTIRQIGNRLLEPVVPAGAEPAATILPPEEVEPTTTPQQPGVAVTPDVVTPAVTQKVGDAVAIPDSPRLTTADRGSPIPNDLIDEGKQAVEGATGQPSTYTTTTVVDGQRQVVTGNVADLVAKDRVETAALIERITAEVSPPVSSTPAPPAGPLATTEPIAPTPTRYPAVVAPEPSLAAPAAPAPTTVELPNGRTLTVENPDVETFRAVDDEGKRIGQMNLTLKRSAPYATSVTVTGQRRIGVARAMYDAAEKALGRRLIPSPLGLSDDAIAFWKNRLNKMEPEEKQAILAEMVAVGKEAGVSKSSRERADRLGYIEPEPAAASPAKQFVESYKSPPGVDVDVSEYLDHPNVVALSNIERTTGEKGAGAAAMRDLVRQADEAGVIVRLTVEKKNLEKLAPYYRKFGFTNVIKRDGDLLMQRNPRPAPQGASPASAVQAPATIGPTEAKAAPRAAVAEAEPAAQKALKEKIAAKREEAAPRAPDETDKAFAKRVVDKRPEPKALPEKYDDYFLMDKATVVPIGDLVSSKTDEENAQGGGNAAKRMAAAAKGELSKRDPITVERRADGKYLIKDGNGTYTSVKGYGWKSMPVIVEGAAPAAQKAATPRFQVADAHKTSFTGETATPEQRARFSRHSYTTIDALYEDAQARQDELGAAGKEIADRIEGISFTNPGLKTREKSTKKIGIKGYDDAGQITDAIRGGFHVNEPGQASQIIRALASHFEVLDEGWIATQQGYFDRKALIRFDDGHIGEVQFWEPHVFQAKEFGLPGVVGGAKGHDIYDEWNTLRKKDPSNPKLDELNQQMNELYAHALSLADARAWAIVLSEGRLSKPAPKYLNLLRQTSSSKMPQVAYTSPKSASTQTVSPGWSSALASKSVKTTGRSSQVQNFTGTPPSGINVVQPAPAVKGETPKFAARLVGQGSVGATGTGGKAGDRVTIADVARKFHEQHMASEGRQLFPETEAADYTHVLNDMAAPELASQMEQKRSGVGWYSQDTADAIDITSQLFPTLATNPEHRDLFLIYAGIFGNGPDPITAWLAAGEAFDLFMRTGEIPVSRSEATKKAGLPVKESKFKDKKTGEMRVQPTGWTQRNAVNEQQIALFKGIVERLGSITAAMHWLTHLQPRSEINKAMRDAGYTNVRYPTVEDLKGSDEYGALVFGPKLGRYILGLNGIELTSEDATVDKWFVRTYRRWTGRLFEGPLDDSGVAGQPNPKGKDIERRTIFRIVADLAQKFKLKPGDVQAVLWFHEQRLYDASGVPTEAGTNTDGANKLLEQRGVRQDVNARSDAKSDSAGRKDEQRAGRRGADRQRADEGTAQAVQRKGQAEVAPLPGLYDLYPASVGPNAKVTAAKQAYMKSIGMPYRRQAEYVKADPARGKRIADAFEAMPHNPADPQVVASYRAMIDETIAQFHALQKALNLKISFIKPGQENPYNFSPRLALQDVMENGHLWVFPTESGFGSLTEISDNPLLEPTDIEIDGHKLVANDVFRIVHDIFGHGPEGAGFGPTGEENAWQSHVRMYSPLAARAMTSETRGQNSWVNFGPHGAANQANPQDTTFADQKIGLLPDWVMTEGMAADEAVRFKVGAAAEAPKGRTETREVEGGVIHYALSPQFAPKAEAFFADLRKALDKFGLTGVKLNTWEMIFADLRGGPLSVNGQYARNLIDIAVRFGDPNVTLSHEVIHALFELALTANEKAILLRKSAKDWITDEIKQNYGQFSKEVQAEEGVAHAFTNWEAGERMDGMIARSFKRIKTFLKELLRVLTKYDIRTADDIFRQIASGKIGQRTQEALFQNEGKPIENPKGTEPLFMLHQPPPSQQQAQQVMQGFIARGQPVDRAIRTPFALLGGIDKQSNRLKLGKRLTDKMGPAGLQGAAIGGTIGTAIGALGGPLGIGIGAAAGATVGAYILGSSPYVTTGQFGWVKNFGENAKRGLIDNYGLDPDYVETYRQSDLGKASILREAQGIMKVLENAGVGTAEAKVLQQILSGKPVNDADMIRVSEPIRKAIDDMGAEAVSLGLISADSFQRNRGAYLHRVYAKNEVDQNTLAGWVSTKMAGRRKKIIGDQLKGRGIFWDITPERLMQDFGFYPKPTQGQKVRVLDRMNAAGDKASKRVYWPANRKVPVEFQGKNWVDRGEWEVRRISDKEVTLWRDYTEEERGKMGEIVDARYTIAKTFMLMANDLSTGRFYRDVAANPEWTSDTEPASEWREAAEYSQHWNDSNIQWVHVPNTAISKTGGKKRWGALADKYVRAEIWRDLNELQIASTPNVWRKLLTQWKLNKTARNPVVHMNNIMSNMIFMDLADIRMQDLAAGLKAYIKGDADFQEAVDNGAFGSDMVAQEIRKDVLEPILEEITKAQHGTKNPFFARAGLLGAFADKLWTGVKKLDNGMLRAYQMEDEVFRMAAYMRRRSQGESPKVAALNARDQFLNYDIRAPWIRMMRNSLFPFISYTYRAVPKLMENILHRPWKLAKYVAIAYAVNALGYLWDDDDEEERERAALRDEEQGNTWLQTPRMIRMPFRDAHGLPVFLDVRRWIPAGDIFDVTQGSSAVPLPSPLHFGGPIQMAFELMLNKKAFDGEEITNALTDTPMEKAAKVADWAWKSWAPASFWTPYSWYWTKIGNAVHGATDTAGRPYSVPQAVLSSLGIKVKPLDVDDAVKWHYLDFRKVQIELKQQFRSNAKRLERGLISQSAHDAAAARIMEKVGNLGQTVQEFGEKIRKSEREPVE